MDPTGRVEGDSAEHPPATLEGDPLDHLVAASGRIEDNLATLSQAVEKRLSYDKTKEDAFDRLYAELEDLKKNSALEHLRPLFIDFILLYDRIESISQSLEQGEPGDPAAAALVRTLGEELVEILCRREVVIVPLSDAFDPTIHRAIGVEPVASDAQSNRVAKVVRRGFRMGNRILRPEEVIVSKNHTKP